MTCFWDDMARPKEFDPDTALEAALELFWRRGYEATSMADLVAHLGISRASLYGTFGSKHELYLTALDRYVQTRNPDLIALLDQAGPALPAVRAFVRRYARDVACDTQGRGCFVVNTAVELLPRDKRAARRVESSWEALERALTAALIRAHAHGELAADKDPRALARLLLVVLQGLRVVGKARPSPERLHDAAEQALALLS
jgi:TetR/AcrR family transcriptional repressor of nem operon